jgi:ABC-type sulfate transport system permease component
VYLASFIQKRQSEMKLVLIVTGTVTDLPHALPHLVSGVIIDYNIDKTGMTWPFNYLNNQMKMYAHWHF